MIGRLFERTAARAALIALLCAGLLAWNWSLKERRRHLSGTFAPVRLETVSVGAPCVGRIEPRIVRSIKAEVSGQRASVKVREGDAVKAGDVLMELASDKIELAADQESASADNARAEWIKAQRDYRRERSLFKQQAVPREAVDAARAQVARSRQDYEIALKQKDAAAREAAGVRVVSPIDGVVLKLDADKEWVSPGDELAVVGQLDSFVLRGKVDELRIAGVAIGQTAVIRCDAYPGKEMRGVVSAIGQQATADAFPQIEVTIDIQDAAGIDLRPNLSADARITKAVLADSLVIPADAVVNGDGGAYVWAAGSFGRLEKRPVVLKMVDDNRAVVAKGLVRNERVLVSRPQ